MTIIYKCDICGQEYEDKEICQLCESLPIPGKPKARSVLIKVDYGPVFKRVKILGWELGGSGFAQCREGLEAQHKGEMGGWYHHDWVAIIPETLVYKAEYPITKYKDAWKNRFDPNENSPDRSQVST